MATTSISEEIALRLALAARALPDIEVRELVPGVIVLLGEPISTGKLNKLRLGKLKQIEILAEIDEVYLKEALAYLKGRNIEQEPEPLPIIEPYTEGAMPGSIRVACASNSGDNINGHFGSCARFLIYQISAEKVKLIDIRVPGSIPDDADKNALRAQLINDSQVLYTISIGGPAAAKVVRAGLHPIKLTQGGRVKEVLERLQETLAGSPPPWLAKVMGQEPEERARYKEEASG
jgi:nitrogen fixation protein NifX